MESEPDFACHKTLIDLNAIAPPKETLIVSVPILPQELHQLLISIQHSEKFYALLAPSFV